MKRLALALALASLAFGGAAYASKVSPTEVPGTVTVAVERAGELFDAGVPFVDVRKNSDFEAGRIPGAIHLELKSAFTEEALAEVVAKDETVVVYCNGESCMRSSEAAAKAVGWGFTDVQYFRDGFPAWEFTGNPVE